MTGRGRPPPCRRGRRPSGADPTVPVPGERAGRTARSAGPDERWRIGLIVDVRSTSSETSRTTVRRRPRLKLETVELRLPDGEPAASVERALAAIDPRDGEATCIELSPAVTGLGDGLAAIAARGAVGQGPLRRPGGRAFPDRGPLAAFLIGAAELGVPFKATAGLHHAVRYRDPATGFNHHGFLNLLLATARRSRAPTWPTSSGAAHRGCPDLADSVRAVSSASADRRVHASAPTDPAAPRSRSRTCPTRTDRKWRAA